MERFKTFLTEAVNYEEIFNSLFKAIPGLVGHTESFIKSEVEWARKTLRKQDRIVWYLQWVRMALVDEWAVDKIKEKEQQKIIKANPDSPTDPEIISRWTKPFYKRNLPQMHANLEHFFSMRIPKIDRYVFKNYVYWGKINTEFDAYDKEWSEGHQGTIKYSLQPLEHHDPYGDSAQDFDGNPIGRSRSGITIVKQFPHEYYWVNLKKYSCELEANAMGHCGNTASGEEGETILSFRKLVKKGNDEALWYWEPHLTFILDAKGYLGEMKGRANDKPTEQYHKYIIALLLDPMIKGIKGGGYAPERNFKLEDLSDEQRDKLFDKKPSLMGVKEYFKRKGKTAELIEKINVIWNDMEDNTTAGIALVWDESFDHAAFAKFKDIHDFVDDYGNDTAKWCSKILSGDKGESFYQDGMDDSSIQEVLDLLNTRKVETRMAEQFPEEWEEEGNDTDLLDFIQRYDDELADVLRTAAYDATERGAENDMIKSFKSGVEDVDVLSSNSEAEVGSAYIPKDGLWDEPMFLYATFKNIMEFVSDEDAQEEGITFKVKVEESHYGWSGWDDDAAKEYLENSEFRDLM